MKTKLLLLIVTIFIFSCSKKDNSQTETGLSGYVIDVKENSKSSTGEIVANNANAQILVWEADNKDFSINSSVVAIGGYAYDNVSGTSVKYDYSYPSSHVEENVPPGKYFVFVYMSKPGAVGDLAHSYINFQIHTGEVVSIKKVFTTRVVNGGYEEWNKAE